MRTEEFENLMVSGCEGGARVNVSVSVSVCVYVCGLGVIEAEREVLSEADGLMGNLVAL